MGVGMGVGMALGAHYNDKSSHAALMAVRGQYYALESVLSTRIP